MSVKMGGEPGYDMIQSDSDSTQNVNPDTNSKIDSKKQTDSRLHLLETRIEQVQKETKKELSKYLKKKIEVPSESKKSTNKSSTKKPSVKKSTKRVLNRTLIRDLEKKVNERKEHVNNVINELRVDIEHMNYHIKNMKDDITILDLQQSNARNPLDPASLDPNYRFHERRRESFWRRCWNKIPNGVKPYVRPAIELTGLAIATIVVFNSGKQEGKDETLNTVKEYCSNPNNKYKCGYINPTYLVSYLKHRQ